MSGLSVPSQGITQSQLDAAVPKPATATPPSVADASVQGSQIRYAREDHTHASKARKAKASVNSATYVWTYPTPFDTGTSPICNAIAQVGAGNADLFNVQVLGTPSHTQCTFQINRVSGGLLGLLLGALSINPTPASITLHMLALEP